MKRLTLLFTFCIFCSCLSGQWSYRVGFNSMYVRGDVDPIRELINGGEISASYNLSKFFYTDATFGFGQMRGVDPIASFGIEVGGGLIEDEYQGVGFNRLHPNYKKNYGFGDFGLSFEPSAMEGLLRFDIGTGLGFSISDTRTDIRNADGDFYNVRTSLLTQSIILESFDGDYETKFSSSKKLLPHLYLKAGVSIDIADNVYLSLNIKTQIANSDHIDTISYRTAIDSTNTKDSVRIISLSFHYGLGEDDF